MKNKNILEIVPHFPFVRSFIAKRADYMCEHNINIHVITNIHPDLEEYKQKHAFRLNGIHLNRMPSIVNDIKAFIYLRRYIEDNDIQMIIGHMIKGRLLTVLLGLFLKKKAVIFVHGTSFETGSFLKKYIFLKLSKFESYFSVGVICVSRFLVDLRLGKNIDKSYKQFVPFHGSCTGIDCDNEFNPNLINKRDKEYLKKSLNINDSDFVIGFCGRLTHDKGIEELVQAFYLVKANKQNVKLLLVGDNDIRDNIPYYIQEKIETDKDIIKTGYISNNIQLYYSIMDLFVLPTHRDGFGMCLIEAASMGIPVLTSNITGSRDAISEGFNGDYVNIDSKDISNKILNLINNNELRKLYAKNGRVWVVQNFKQEMVWKDLMKEYNRLYNL